MKTLTGTLKPLLALAISLSVIYSTTAIASGQGTITATLHNDCTGNRDVGVNVALIMESGVDFNLNVPEKNNNPLSKLWLKCGEKVTKTLKYDMPDSDYQVNKLISRAYYMISRGNQEVKTVTKPYSWLANGTHCSITYTGMSSPITDISCQKN